MAGFGDWLKGLFGAAADAAVDSPTPQIPTDTAATEPDLPVAFGYKVSWFAAQTHDPAALADALGLTNVRSSTWSAGIEAAYATPPAFSVFLTPPVRGWVLAVGRGLPTPGDEPAFEASLLALAQRFPELQFFATYRVSEFHAWARAIEGRIVRLFASSGERGEVMANSGELTADERALGLPDLGRLGPEGATERLLTLDEALAGGKAAGQRSSVFADEEDVILLARAWSVDPTILEEMDLPPSLGLIGWLPGVPALG
jgi:hypothetical protein